MAISLGKVFEPFVAQRPICVMARGVLENPHSIGFSGGQLSSYVEGSSALDFPLVHDVRSRDQP
jgi:hypothetical protein